uniref:Uncharacterized protein n=1 Tax=Magallana gigas TaxID=29159 RepID=K1PB78_MAGGI
MDLCETTKTLSFMYHNAVLYIVIVLTPMLFEVNVVSMGEATAEEETSATCITSSLATASPSSQATSSAEGAPGGRREPPPAISTACHESSDPFTSLPPGSLTLSSLRPIPDWAYSQEGIIMAKCERCHQRFRHSTVACRNCQQRSACCSCIRQLKHGDPADNRCPSCFYF